jgi:hypothetical protein
MNLLYLFIFLAYLPYVFMSYASEKPQSLDANSDGLAVFAYHPEVYEEARLILEHLRSAPSCTRLATQSLIESCRTLEVADIEDPALKEEKEKYSARLAMCELVGAEVTLPLECEAFVMSDRHCKKKASGGFINKLRGIKPPTQQAYDSCFAEPTILQQQLCLRAIAEKPQWWISYSNARQNALTICQASRIAIEKGKTVIAAQFSEIFQLLLTQNVLTFHQTRFSRLTKMELPYSRICVMNKWKL